MKETEGTTMSDFSPGDFVVVGKGRHAGQIGIVMFVDCFTCTVAVTGAGWTKYNARGLERATPKDLASIPLWVRRQVSETVGRLSKMVRERAEPDERRFAVGDVVMVNNNYLVTHGTIGTIVREKSSTYTVALVEKNRDRWVDYHGRNLKHASKNDAKKVPAWQLKQIGGIMGIAAQNFGQGD